MMARDSNYIGGPVGSVIVDYAYAEVDEKSSDIHYFDANFNEIGIAHEGTDGSYVLTRDFSEDGSVMKTVEYHREQDGSVNIAETSYDKMENGIVIGIEVVHSYDNDGSEIGSVVNERFFVCDTEIGEVYEMTESEYKEFCDNGTIGGIEVTDGELKNQILSVAEDSSYPIERTETHADSDNENKNLVETDNTQKLELGFEYKTEDNDTHMQIEYSRMEIDEDGKMMYYDADNRIVATIDVREGETTTEIYRYDKDGLLQEKTEITEKDGQVEKFFDVSYDRESDGSVRETVTEILYLDNGEVVELERENIYEYDAETGEIHVTAFDENGREDYYIIDSNDERYEGLCDVLGVEGADDADKEDLPDAVDIGEDTTDGGEDPGDIGETELNNFEEDESNDY